MKVAIYVRTATADPVAMDVQKNGLINYANSQGYEIFNIYEDDGYSGKILERPALNKLLVDIAANKIDELLVYRLDRLTRCVDDMSRLSNEILTPNKVKLTALF